MTCDEQKDSPPQSAGKESLLKLATNVSQRHILKLKERDQARN